MILENCFHFSLPASFTYMLYNKEEPIEAQTITLLTSRLFPGLVQKFGYTEIKEPLRNLTFRTKELILYTSLQMLYLTIAQHLSCAVRFKINKGSKHVKTNSF